MDEIFKICELQNGTPITADKYLTPLKDILKSEQVPATITKQDIVKIKELQAKLNQANENEEEQQPAEEDIEDVAGGGTTPLHAIVSSVDPSISAEELQVIESMIDTLFEWGAGWMIVDENDETPACICLRRKLPESLYKKFVAAGVRAEIFLSRMLEEDEDEEEEKAPKLVESTTESDTVTKGDTADSQNAYLAAPLEYTNHTLITQSHKDGVMMDWETPIMKRSAEIITTDSDNDGTGPVVLNIGFGMGIIDSFIQDLKPKRHFICEAHPQVLEKMKADGWYDKPGVTVLEGSWKSTLPGLLDQCLQEQLYFDGIYYDTFSEHYKDLTELFDYVVGIMKPTGKFSFFNGLGADRQVCYDVYKEVVEIDLNNYGLEVEFEQLPVKQDKKETQEDDKTWDGIRMQYFKLDEYWLPIIKFMS